MELNESPLQTGLLKLLPLSTARLVLRPMNLGDADALYALHSDNLLTRHAGGSKTREQSLASLERIVERTQVNGFGPLGIQERDSDSVIGWCGVQPFGDHNRYEVIYALKPDRWGRGFAMEAASALMSAVFQLRQLDINEIYAIVFPQNTRSLKVIHKLGMSFNHNIHDDITKRYACVYSVDRSTFLRLFPPRPPVTY